MATRRSTDPVSYADFLSQRAHATGAPRDHRHAAAAMNAAATHVERTDRGRSGTPYRETAQSHVTHASEAARPDNAGRRADRVSDSIRHGAATDAHAARAHREAAAAHARSGNPRQAPHAAGGVPPLASGVAGRSGCGRSRGSSFVPPSRRSPRQTRRPQRPPERTRRPRHAGQAWRDVHALRLRAEGLQVITQREEPCT